MRWKLGPRTSDKFADDDRVCFKSIHSLEINIDRVSRQRIIGDLYLCTDEGRRNSKLSATKADACTLINATFFMMKKCLPDKLRIQKFQLP